MNNAMLGLFNLGAGEIILILAVLLMMSMGVIGCVLLIVWLLARNRNAPTATPPVQPPTSPPPKMGI